MFTYSILDIKYHSNLTGATNIIIFFYFASFLSLFLFRCYILYRRLKKLPILRSLFYITT